MKINIENMQILVYVKKFSKIFFFLKKKNVKSRSIKKSDLVYAAKVSNLEYVCIKSPSTTIGPQGALKISF